MAQTFTEIKRNFSQEDWDRTPKSVRDAYERLETIVLKLLERVDALEIQINKNSRNSSKPPSTDSPYDKNSVDAEDDSGNKKNGKPGPKKGHIGYKQKLMESTNKIDIMPDRCSCGNDKFKEIESFYTHQEIELPEIEMIVNHFNLHKGKCCECGNLVKSTVPKEHSTGYGPRLSAFIGEVAGIQGNSRDTIKTFCSSVLNFHISPGAIQKVIYRISEAIKPHYELIGKEARKSKVNGIDETSWFRNGKLMWLWTMANKKVIFFMLQKKRTKEAFLKLIEDWDGVLISDGYRLYQKWINFRQACLAHLIRDAKGLKEQKNNIEIQKFGENALSLLQELCAMAKAPPTSKEWHNFYIRLIDLITEYQNRHNDAGKFARRLSRELNSLWTFLLFDDVEPTNNQSERALRFGVLWRIRSYGTRSENGERWIERILSLRQTARLKGKATYAVLTNAMTSFFKGQDPDLSWITVD